MKKYQKEYETYMKKVSDAFITMNADSINESEWHANTSVFYCVHWKNGLEYTLELDFSRFLSGITYEEMKKYNFEISKKYLQANAISYDEWFKNFKNKLIYETKTKKRTSRR
jgi:hypothetical protein